MRVSNSIPFMDIFQHTKVQRKTVFSNKMR